MVANKVTLNGETIIDLTQDDTLEEDVALGKRFHKPNGDVGYGTWNVSGNLEITANGDYNVKNKESVTVKVPQAKARIKDNVLYITLEA
jgi:hypothetical protein